LTEADTEVATGTDARLHAVRRVLMISTLWPPVVTGGAELYAYELCRRLTASGVEVGVVTAGVRAKEVVAQVSPWPYHWGEARSAWRKAVYHSLDTWRPGATRTIAQAIRSFRPEVVHSHVATGLSMAALKVPSALGVAHVHTIHDYWLLCLRSTLLRSGRACDSRCGLCRAAEIGKRLAVGGHFAEPVLCVSEAVKAEHERLAWLRDRLEVLQLPHDVAEPVPIPGHGPFVFGYIGRLVPEKGLTTLLAAFKDLGAPHRLVVAGRGPLEALLATPPPGVEYRGWVVDKSREDFFRGVHCLVVPSEWKDPSPLVVHEALGYGLPVIGARIGGLPEIVDPACRPLLFRSGDAANLTAALRAFVAYPGAYVPSRSFGLTWEIHVGAILDAYKRAINAVAA